ncbi:MULTISPECIES: hypothetical protein [Williamsia]|uniref:Uncharacterized protein n=1 Tax=Williamsia limnetica TaxID=882452 RepID=A0A318RBL4_WILLI|nr:MULTISPECIES: hypothetical protein [Williamsia]ORM38158.1 hypothetical protein BFL43_00995 [Williamsia sp. 1135]PYE12487.1 hypothetical protein DFR67_12271 [Williamsia limnetica]
MSRPPLTVLIDGLSIEDGAMAPPRIGSVIELVLDFVESATQSPEVMTIQAVLDLHPTARQDRGSPAGEDHLWTGDLHGDGWRATWRGDRRRSGPVTLTGRLTHWHSISYSPAKAVRGFVTRIQVVSSPYHAPSGVRWEPQQHGSRRYRDVEKTPPSFDRGGLFSVSPAADIIRYREMGILVDLDLEGL